MSAVQALMEKYKCDAARAQRFLDLVADGCGRYEALLLAGLINPAH